VKNKYSCLLILLIFQAAHSQTSPAPVNEDRVRNLVNQEMKDVKTELNANLKEQLETKKKELDLQAKAIEDKLDFIKFVLTLGGLSIIATFYGAIKIAKKYFEKRVKEETDLAIFKTDPREWEILVPRQNFDEGYKRLKALKYKKLKYYNGFDDLKPKPSAAITIYYADSNENLKDLHDFMADAEIDPLKYLFIIYSTGKENLDKKVLLPFDNYIFSNMPSTLSSQIFAASRSIAFE